MAHRPVTADGRESSAQTQDEISVASSIRKFRQALYSVCLLTDFSAFIIVFTVSRGLAETKIDTGTLGLVGAGLSFSAGIGSLVGGWLSDKYDSRVIFLTGAVGIIVSSASLSAAAPDFLRWIPFYWLLGISIGFVYPPLIGWLNRNEQTRERTVTVSRTLVLFCISWNVGMMAGQLTAGLLHENGSRVLFAVAVGIAILNLIASVLAVVMYSRLNRSTDRAADVVDVGGGSLSSDSWPSDSLEGDDGARFRSDSLIPVGKTSTAEAANFQRLSWIANIGGMFGGSLVIHLLPDLAVSLGIPADHHGVILAGWRLVIVMTYFVLHRFSFWQFRMSVSVGSQMLAFCGLLLIAAAGSLLTLSIGLAMLGQLVGYNYFAGLFYSTVGSQKQQRATAAGIHEATLAGGMAVGTAIGGFIGSAVSHSAPYVLAAIILFGMLLVQIELRRRQRLL